MTKRMFSVLNDYTYYIHETTGKHIPSFNFCKITPFYNKELHSKESTNDV